MMCCAIRGHHRHHQPGFFFYPHELRERKCSRLMHERSSSTATSLQLPMAVLGSACVHLERM
jgi:hypothetical protein